MFVLDAIVIYGEGLFYERTHHLTFEKSYQIIICGYKLYSF